ncbi:MAG: hypothetical protein IJ583_02685 [Firmicutes bacterium]|nr:hypothetical protein [Bacillota bacterium]
MLKFLNVYLLTSMMLFNGSCVKVSEVYTPCGHTSIYFSDGQYYEKSCGGINKTSNNYNTIRECLHICPDFKIYNFAYPDEIEGIGKEIPYNYTASKELSANVLYSVVYKDWEIIRYEADPVKITAELTKDGVLCRIVIYEDRLKVYQKVSF